MSDWISVNDKLPEFYDFVLVCANFQGTGEPKPIQIARRYNAGIDGEQWEFCNEAPIVGVQGAWMDMECGIDTNDITHWMPLPKPPEG